MSAETRSYGRNPFHPSGVALLSEVVEAPRFTPGSSAMLFQAGTAMGVAGSRSRNASGGRVRMPEAGGGSVQLLEADPDLARGLDPRRIREVSQRLFVRAIDAPRGTWTPGRSLSQGSQPIGLLVLDGLLVREATVGDHPCAELLGPGDLLRAWDDREAEILLPRTVEWTA